MVSTESQRRRHLHLYFCPWQHESRAFRAGATALEAGLADEVHYVGYRADGFADEERIDDRQLIRRIGPQPVRPGSPRLLRAMSVPRWWRAIVRTQCSRDVALVTAHSIAALPGAVMAARRSGAGLLYDAHELETEREGWSPMIRWFARCFERFFIRRCDHTVVVNDAIRAWYERAYPGLSVSTVRNVPVIPPVTGPSRLRESLGISKDPLLYVYCGIMGRGRGLFEMIDAFGGLSQEHHLAIVGFGPLEAEVKAAASKHSNIHLHPAVDQSELIALLSGADVGVHFPTGTSTSYHISLPNKVFEYSAAGLALMVSDAPELKRFASEHPLARSVPVSVENIRHAVATWSKEELRGGRASMRFQPPSWQQESKRLLDAYQVVETRRQARVRR